MRWDAPWGYLPVEPGGPCLCPVAPRLVSPAVYGMGLGIWRSWNWVRAPCPRSLVSLQVALPATVINCLLDRPFSLRHPLHSHY